MSTAMDSQFSALALEDAADRAPPVSHDPGSGAAPSDNQALHSGTLKISDRAPLAKAGPLVGATEHGAAAGAVSAGQRHERVPGSAGTTEAAANAGDLLSTGPQASTQCHRRAPGVQCPKRVLVNIPPEL